MDRYGWTRSAAGIGMAVLLSACGGGGGNSGPTPVVPTPTPAPQPQVLAQVSGSVPADAVVGLTPLTTTRTGSFDITLDWTFARNDLDVALGRGSCLTEDDFTSGRCIIINATTSTTVKPEHLHVDAQPAGTYYVLVANFSSEEESAAVQVVFTPSSASTGIVRAESARPVDLARWRSLHLSQMR